MQTFDLWDKVPGLCEETPVIEYYPASNKVTSATVVILPGGGYSMRAQHEGKGYAEFFNIIGMDAFVCQYRVSPHAFPLPLIDSRRAVRFVRANAERFGIDPDRVAIMGSSAGGHLSALTCTYTDKPEFDGDDSFNRFSPFPNAAILCYPVICSPDTGVAHVDSFRKLTGTEDQKVWEKYSCERMVNEVTPPTFLWHTSDDPAVNVANSLRYGEALRKQGIKFEMHIFPSGKHGLGLSQDVPYVSRWSGLLREWLVNLGWL